MLDDVTKDLKKTAQKEAIASAIGHSMNQKIQTNKQNAKQTGETKLSELKTNMATVSESMGNSVKGQFGKKVKKAFKKQSESLDKF
ncbi:hypothetical protein UAY_03243 [Enterococcus moraviensis ATCC BAA-383]|uniref:Uncharacterized protein n=1 Tax=Enterococcus moraviensis ATCC BAA-383 TaxID=1158609 RepID=R2QGY1_9ENTE|nr:hypothetical protein [Enterococcus moraviensis]EOH95817.1 hypothetical protein UAY_03243 [Enterococcus moraviensis ATCC BAA-383]EOT66304.1 hypothetical protein I586_02575 [Enterococcus moraviensis ATCC BAA-383]OJG67632.1 hypothetical protein RV09_GL002401 [Enterococcus moraviensis]